MTDNSDTLNQDEPFPDATSVIEAFGGVRPMASQLGVAATTIQGWKSRGSVPPPRRQEVRDAATAAGIDLDNLPESAPVETPPTDDTMPEPASETPEHNEPEEAVSEPTPPPKPAGQGIAWLALLVAIAAGVALYTQPQWSPLVYGPSTQAVPQDVFARIDALEARPAAPALGPVNARLDALDAALKAVPSDSGASATLTEELGQLAQKLAQNVEKTDRLVAQVDEAERSSATLRADTAAASESLRMEIAALRGDLSALDTKLSALGAREAAAAGRTTGLALAVVSLERAVLDGTPFAGLLTAIERLSDDDPVVTDAMAVLAPDAKTGIPTAADLIKRFDNVATTLGEPLWAETGTGWFGQVLSKVDSVISVRRIEDGEGNILPARRAELAVARGDLQAAVAVLGDAAGPAAADWVRDAKRHIAAQKAVAALRVHAVEMLGTGMSATGAPQ